MEEFDQENIEKLINDIKTKTLFQIMNSYKIDDLTLNNRIKKALKSKKTKDTQVALTLFSEYLFTRIPIECLSTVIQSIPEKNKGNYNNFIRLNDEFEKGLNDQHEQKNMSLCVFEKMIDFMINNKDDYYHEKLGEYFFEGAYFNFKEKPEYQKATFLKIMNSDIKNNNKISMLLGTSKEVVEENSDWIKENIDEIIYMIENLNNFYAQQGSMNFHALENGLARFSKLILLLPNEMKGEITPKIVEAEESCVEKYGPILRDHVYTYIKRVHPEMRHVHYITTEDIKSSNIENIIEQAKKDKFSVFNLEINSCADLSCEDIENLQSKGIELHQICIKNEHTEKIQHLPYSLEDYKSCRKIIDSIIEDIPNLKSSEGLSEKEIFGIVIRRLANIMKYNNEYREQVESEYYYYFFDEKEAIENANMVGGLLKGKTVCSGYSEIIRNVFSCIGIEVENFSADSKDKMPGHVWNQIKLDDDWYWMDLTWDVDRIVCEESPENLLKSDTEMEESKTNFKLEGLSGYHKCSKTISNEQMKEYLRYENHEDNVFIGKLMREALMRKRAGGLLEKTDVQEYETVLAEGLKQKDNVIR